MSEFEEKEETTTRDVSIIMNTLKKLCPAQEGQRVHYFKFIVDPKSFSRTIENVFHFSFLVKVSDRHILTRSLLPSLSLSLSL